MSGLDRRTFIGTSAAAVAAGLAGQLPDAEAAKRKKKPAKKKKPAAKGPRKADVIIVGAGFAGLTAAHRLREKGKSVLVLEARKRVGGRVDNHHLPNGVISEAGGTFVGPTQDRVIGLGKELGVGIFPTFNEGQNVFMKDGQRSTFSDTSPTGSAPLDPALLADLAVVVTQLNEMSRTVPVDAPWDAPRAAEWDAKTLDEFIRETATNPDFRKLAGAATRPIFGMEPRDLSLLFVLFYIAASGDERNFGTFERNFNTRAGAQESRFVGGSHVIAERIAEKLGKSVVLGAPVRRIVQENGRVTVEADGVTAVGKRVIVAVPPTLAGRIDYSPLLPESRDQLTQRMSQGFLGKVAAVYDRPFWREQGLTGQALSTTGPVTATFDDSPPDGKPGIIFGFVGGDELRRFLPMPAAQRRQAVLDQFTGFFGAEAGKPVDYFETMWPQEQWSRGGPVGIAGPGTLFAVGHTLRKPVGRIHWAGTETSTYWNGYMDGAVRSGERAAREVLDQL